MKRTLLFDLDDTLIVEERAAAAAFAATAQSARSVHPFDVKALAADARIRARELWYAAPTYDWCMRVAISSWEGLWCRFEGEVPHLEWLRSWAPEYRRETWHLAMADQGLDDRDLATELGHRFVAERRSRHEVFNDAEPTLRHLASEYQLVLLTNGASCLQREKLAASGLADHFELVVVSADLGVAKPHREIFEYALAELDVDPRHAVMIGDSLSRDIEGAVAAGFHGVWVNRTRQVPTSSSPADASISSLDQLPAALVHLA